MRGEALELGRCFLEGTGLKDGGYFKGEVKMRAVGDGGGAEVRAQEG